MRFSPLKTQGQAYQQGPQMVSKHPEHSHELIAWVASEHSRKGKTQK